MREFRAEQERRATRRSREYDRVMNEVRRSMERIHS